MDEEQKERWAEVRAKGAGRFMLRGIMAAALCVVAGHVIWWLVTLAWRGEPIPYFVREPGPSVAMAVGFLIAGYLQASREWRTSEREYFASAETNGNEATGTRTSAILTTACTRPPTRTFSC
jgi:hypothetical protein